MSSASRLHWAHMRFDHDHTIKIQSADHNEGRIGPVSGRDGAGEEKGTRREG